MAEEVSRCQCGAEISRWAKRCQSCRENAIIDGAVQVQPSAPLLLIDSDTFFHDLQDASADRPGAWAHPCDEEPLKLNPKRVAADLCERVFEDMCEEAFEDAEGHLNGKDELEAAFVAALETFNAAQTACSWLPRVNEVFQIPETPNPESPQGEVNQSRRDGE